MNEVIEYLLRATVIWAVLLGYYFLVVNGKSSFRFQRFYLLGSWLFGLAVPLLPGYTPVGEIPVLPLPNFDFIPEVIVAATGEESAQKSWETTSLLPYAYLLITLIILARTLVQSWVLWQWTQSGERGTQAGFSLVRHREVMSPFAAWGHIFLPADWRNTDLTNTALIHETAHLRARHHYDNTLLTIGSILLWFHPLTWVYRQLLSVVHEYEADAAVIQRVPVRTYGLQLLQSAQGPARKLGLFSSPLKKRINMMTQKKNHRPLRLLPLLTLVFLLAGLIVACSDAAKDLPTPLPETETIAGLEMMALAPETENLIDAYPKPVDAGSAEATKETLLRAIYENVRYPKASRQAGEIGFVRVMIGISSEGDLTNITVVGMEAVDDENPKDNIVVIGYGEEGGVPTVRAEPFTEEVDRVFNAMAPFTPAMKDGKAIPVTLTFDFKFDLKS
ncbi:MAG: M56 family metallopeptidase [Bacteroidota bacterium]